MTAPAHPGPVLQRLDGVDVLRGLSILAVILLHIRIALYFRGTNLGATLPSALRYLFFNNGNNGVFVFFAVSGFLITLTSLRRFGSLAAMRPRVFYRIRFARIAPPLLAVLAVLSLLHLTHAPGFRIRPQIATLPRALVAALTFHLNWLEGTRGYLPGSWDVLWSLSIEEMFYLFFPLACLALLRLPRGMLLFLLLLLSLLVTGPYARTVWTEGRPVWQEKSYLGGMDGIAMGCLFALLTHWLAQREGIRNSRYAALHPALCPAIAGLGIAMMLLVVVWPWPHWNWLHALRSALGRSGTDDTVLPLGTCLVMMATTLRSRPGSRWTAPLRWFGRHSYEIYLTHEWLVVWGTNLYVRGDRRGPLWLWIVAIVLASALLGGAFARFYSEPLNRLLRGSPSPRAPAGDGVIGLIRS